MADMVNHPPHYSADRFGIECIAITRHMSFNAGNAFKYLWRHLDKGFEKQDLSKAVWYLKELASDTCKDPIAGTVGPTIFLSEEHMSVAVSLYIEHVFVKAVGAYNAMTAIILAQPAAAIEIIEARLDEIAQER